MNSFCSRCLAASALFAILSSSIARAEGLAPEEALKHFKLPEGFSVRLFAAEPDVRQPVSMTFDHRGRMWVIQYLQYPNPAGLKVVKVDRYLRTVYDRVPEPPPKGPRGVDRITICEDTDGDGRADKFKDFISGLNLTTGLALGHGGAFVIQAPYLLFYADRDGDDVPDGDPEVLLTGFGMEDSHAYANSLQWGPDGWLYGAQGSTVTAHIRGLTFQQGIWRYHPRTKEFELFAEGGGNTWGADFDRHGAMIAGTNAGGHAMLHQVQGAYYVKGFEKHGALQNPYSFGYFEHVPYSGFRGGHVTCGGIVYQGGAFPEQFRNQYIAANLLSNAIHWHKIEPHGSTFRNRLGGELLTTDDTWFRPVDCTVGPDGSLFVADWYDKRANHVDPKDDWDKTNGRIYQVVAAGTQPVGKLDTSALRSIELVNLLSHKNVWFAREARLLLAERQDASILPALEKRAMEDENAEAALQAFWAIYVSGGWNEGTALAGLSYENPHIREWSVRLEGDERKVSDAVLARLVELAKSESDPAVRSQLACTAKRLPGEAALAIVAPMLRRDADAADPHIPLLLWWAIEDKAIAHRADVLALFQSSDIWSAELVKSVVAERVSRRYAAAGSDDDFAVCAQLLSLAPDRSSVDLIVRGMEQGLAGRKLAAMPAPLAKPWARLWSERRQDASFVALAMRLGSDEAFSDAIARAVNRATPQSERLSLLATLAQIGDPSRVLEPFLNLVAEDEPAAVRQQAIQALQRFDDPRVPARLLEVYPAAPPDLRQRIRAALAKRKSWAAVLLAEVDAGRIPPDQVAADQLRDIALHNDPKLQAIIEKHWGKIAEATPDEKRARIHGINVSLGLASGDRRRGKELFTKQCGVCHTLFGEGNKVGPELTGADRQNREFLLTNIVDPSAVIRKEYFNYVLQTTDGRVLTGLIAESTPQTVTILDAKNERTVVPQSEVETLDRAALSLMPENILDTLDAQQVRDLMSYLQSKEPVK